MGLTRRQYAGLIGVSLGISNGAGSVKVGRRVDYGCRQELCSQSGVNGAGHIRRGCGRWFNFRQNPPFRDYEISIHQAVPVGEPGYSILTHSPLPPDWHSLPATTAIPQPSPSIHSDPPGH